MEQNLSKAEGLIRSFFFPLCVCYVEMDASVQIVYLCVMGRGGGCAACLLPFILTPFLTVFPLHYFLFPFTSLYTCLALAQLFFFFVFKGGVLWKLRFLFLSF